MAALRLDPRRSFRVLGGSFYYLSAEGRLWRLDSAAKRRR
jgi:hypothetical protein